MPNIYILWATIRPTMLVDTYKIWMNRCKNKDNVFLKIAVINEKQKQEIDNFNFQNCQCEIVDEKPGYNYAITRLTQQLEVKDEDILLLLSDDFSPPSFLYWDEYLINKFYQWDGAVFLNDGYQSLVKEGCLCITLACLTFKCLKKLNKIVFHPDYRHFFSDNEAFKNLKELGLLKDDRDLEPDAVFLHRHYVTGWRKQDEYDVQNYASWEQDNKTFDRRINLSIEERLKV